MRLLRWLAVFFCMTCCGTWAAAQDFTARRVALVIGNGAYTQVPRLANPPSDAAAIGQALREVGFSKVTVATDLNHEQLFAALRQFSIESSGADWSLLYYAGHGIEVDGKNYLVPVDAHLAIDRDIEFEGISMQTVLAAVSGARQLRLVILDACRDNPFLNQMKQTIGSRSITRGLARIEPQGDLFIVYSAKSGEVALDGENGRSPFVSALLKNIVTPGLEVNMLFRRVHSDVTRATNGQQEPAFEGTLPGEELYFKSPSTTALIAPPAPPAPTPSAPSPAMPQPAVPAPAMPQPAVPAPVVVPLLVETKPAPEPSLPQTPAPAALPALPTITAKLESPPPVASARDIALAVNTELKRLGCGAGAVNGDWTIQSRIALLKFSQHVGVVFDVDHPDAAALDVLRLQRGIVCLPELPSVVVHPPRPAVPQRAAPGFVVPQHAVPVVVVPKHVAPPPRRIVQKAEAPAVVRPRPHPAAAAPPHAPSQSCFMFNGERVCE